MEREKRLQSAFDTLIVANYSSSSNSSNSNPAEGLSQHHTVVDGNVPTLKRLAQCRVPQQDRNRFMADLLRCDLWQGVPLALSGHQPRTMRSLWDLAAAKLPPLYRAVYERTMGTNDVKYTAIHRLYCHLAPMGLSMDAYVALEAAFLRFGKLEAVEVMARNIHETTGIRLLGHRAPTQYPLPYEPFLLYIEDILSTKATLSFSLRCLNKTAFYINVEISKSDLRAERILEAIHFVKFRHPENINLPFVLFMENISFLGNVLAFRIRCRNRPNFYIALQVDMAPQKRGPDPNISAANKKSRGKSKDQQN